MVQNDQIIIIKGTKDGLTIFIDDGCSFEDALKELEEKVSVKDPVTDSPSVKVSVKLGKRYINHEQHEKLSSVLNHQNNMQLETIDSEVVLKEDALAWKEESDVKVIHRMIRSGQILNVTGDLLLVGDVNPGGKVTASGNIYVMGRLAGIAHAGTTGDQDVIIAASYMKPTQLRIADYISRAPDYESDGVYMECGFVEPERNKIVIDQLRAIKKHHKDLSGFERRMYNG
ncbi:putative septum site-determining protein MinC [Lentibacillus sp. JNUCC-1]|uniref:septum site-determining protein MinC n=1 Tax=Lentibacillus sp. JNUCC-1 TaxID=2654513 RepID=UPI0012E79E81|nr:septum site-determining protein MinC [Lentibacillus sp. JNUCC-1]MUV39500.1 putative septum site-determining protein MinC [Lentibacillus sp. JNUCC-1]